MIALDPSRYKSPTVCGGSWPKLDPCRRCGVPLWKISPNQLHPDCKAAAKRESESRSKAKARRKAVN